MDEVIDPAMTVKVTGHSGLILYILYKIINSNLYDYLFLLIRKNKININYFKDKFRCFHTNFVRASKRIGPHDEDVISVIIGSLLGDGYCNKRKGEGCRICFRQSNIHREYLFWLYDFLHIRGYCSDLKPRLYKRKINNIEKVYIGYEFNTYTFSSFIWIYNLFNEDGKKVVNPNIEYFLSPLSLAIWIKDDGGWTGYGIRISTNAFTHKEVLFLTKILYKKFKIETTIQKLSRPAVFDKKSAYKDKYSIYIKLSSVVLVRNLVEPYFHPSMLYKLGI